MAAIPKLSVVAPCENDEETWRREFVAYAKRLDADDFPLEGEFAMGFSCPLDLSTATLNRKEQMKTAARKERERKGVTVKDGEVNSSVGSLLNAYTLLQPGTIFAFKRGLKVVAFAMITAPYRYDATQAWGKHRWSYRVLRKATVQEEGQTSIPRDGTRCAQAAPVRTFNKDFIEMPADLPALVKAGEPKRHLMLADQKVAELREAVALAAEAAKTAAEALAAAQSAVEAAQAALAGQEARLATAMNERELAELF